MFVPSHQQTMDDDAFSHKVRMLAALSFVLVHDVIYVFEALSEGFPLDAQSVTDYFDDTLILKKFCHGGFCLRGLARAVLCRGFVQGFMSVYVPEQP